jgi:hypothetical protein
LPQGRHAAIRPPRSRSVAARQKNRTAARLRWIGVLAFSVTTGAALTINLAGKPAAHPAPKTPLASALGSATISDAELAQAMPHRPSLQPALPAARPPSANRTPVATPSATATPTPVTPAPSPSPEQTTPAPSPSPTASGRPAATAENQTPWGANELAWSEAILTALGDPLTDANIVSLGYWMQNEAGSPPSGIVGANNPINVSQPGYGGWPIKYEGNGWSLYSYPTPQDGIAATVKYLTPTGYPLILAALKSGQGLSSSSLAGELSEYSGGGYRQIPDAWGASQGRPQT